MLSRAWLKRLTWTLVFLTAFVTVAACASVGTLLHGRPLLASFTPRFLAAPPGSQFVDAAWWASQSEFVVVLAGIDPEVWDYTIEVMSLEGAQLHPLELPSDPSCAHTARMHPRILSDGRLAYLEECVGSPYRDTTIEAFTMMVFDPVSHTASRLVPYFLPYGASTFDFAPDMRVGILNDMNGLYERLYWLYPDHLAPVNTGFARDGRPSWSPDGKSIAVDGAPEALGRTDVSRQDLPRRLYLLSSTGAIVRPILNGFVGASDNAWSPDGKWIAVVVEYSLRPADEALILVNVETGRSYRLLEPQQQSFGGAIWSPDGRSLVTIVDHSTARPASAYGLYVYDGLNLDQLTGHGGEAAR